MRGARSVGLIGAVALLAGGACGSEAPPGDGRAAERATPAPATPPPAGEDRVDARHLDAIKAATGLTAPTLAPLCRLNVAGRDGGWLLEAECAMPTHAVDGAITTLGGACVATADAAVSRARPSGDDGMTRWRWTADVPHTADGKASLETTPCVVKSSPEALILSGLPAIDGLRTQEGAAVAPYWEVQLTLPRGAVAEVNALTETRANGAARFGLDRALDLALVLRPNAMSFDRVLGAETIHLAFVEGDLPQAERLATVFRRGLESAETLLGSGRTEGASPARLDVVLTDALVPFATTASIRGVFVGRDQAAGEAPPSLSQLVANADANELVATLLLQHPARHDVVELAGLTALLRARAGAAFSADPLTEALKQGFSAALALEAVAEAAGDKARRRHREFAWTIPWQQAVGNGLAEPRLADGATADTSELVALKVAFMAEAVWRELGRDAGRQLTRDVLAAPVIDVDTLRAWLRRAGPVASDADRFATTWLDGVHLNETLGPLSLARILEYGLIDGGIELLKASALEEMKQNPAFAAGAVGLLGGEGLTVDPLLDLVEGALPADAQGNKWVQGALDAGRLILGADASARKDATDRLVDELGNELGLDPARRGQVRMLAEEVFKAIDRDRPARRAPGDEPLQDE